MATLDSELALVKRFYTVSQNYATRPSIARRNTLPSLLRFLESKEREIRKYSLDAVYLLAQHPDNVFYLGENPELVTRVFTIYQDGQYDDPELCEKASLVLDCLRPAFDGNDPREGEVLRRATHEGGLSAPSREGSVVESSCRTIPVDVSDGELEEPSNVNDLSRISESSGRRSVGYSQDAPVSVLIEIPALHPRINARDIEAVLQGTTGVLSYTVYAPQKHVKVFLNSQRQLTHLQQNLSGAGYVNLVLKTERFGRLENPSVPKKSYFDPDNAAPSYLSTAKSFASSLYGAVIAYTNPDNNTVAARVQRRRQLEERGDRTDSTAERIGKAFAKWW